MMGPTGVGKTEIARRLSHLARAPFIKVEATKFTEVGYVGREVDSIVRDLTDTAVKMVRETEMDRVRHRAREAPSGGSSTPSCGSRRARARPPGCRSAATNGN